MTGTKILAVGAYAPERVVVNSEFESFLDTSDEWITTRSGIRRRHFSSESNCSMAVKAAQHAIQKAGIDAQTIDLIIGTTVTGDTITPAMANLVQKHLGVEHAVSFDINAACTGFVYAMDVANQFIANGRVKRAMVVSAERISKIVDFTDRSTCVLFGDGAGAILLEADENSPVPTGAIHTTIDEKDVLYCTSFDDSCAFDHHTDVIRMDGLKMNGREVYKFAVHAMSKSVQEVLTKTGKEISDVDILVPHQANERIVRTAAQRLGIEMDKVALCMDEYGNTSSASIPLALNKLEQEGRLQHGQTIVLTGFGAGLTYGAVLLQW